MFSESLENTVGNFSDLRIAAFGDDVIADDPNIRLPDVSNYFEAPSTHDRCASEPSFFES